MFCQYNLFTNYYPVVYNGNNSTTTNVLTDIITLPFSFLSNISYDYDIFFRDNSVSNSSKGYTGSDMLLTDTTTTSSESSNKSSSSKEYSTTNIQVENVDEADITKTDGDYIYSISDSNVLLLMNLHKKTS